MSAFTIYGRINWQTKSYYLDCERSVCILPPRTPPWFDEKFRYSYDRGIVSAFRIYGRINWQTVAKAKRLQTTIRLLENLKSLGFKASSSATLSIKWSYKIGYSHLLNNPKANLIICKNVVIYTTLLKFGLSEKHTKICAIFLMLCTFT